jgi:hypothetical protein
MRNEHEGIVERPGGAFGGMRVSWGGIRAGVLVVLGALQVLSTLGLASGSRDSRVRPASPARCQCPDSHWP